MLPGRSTLLNAALAAICVATLGCGGSESEADAPAGVPSIGAAPSRGQPPVILISLDTLRADRLGVYGYDKPTTPNLAAVAAGAKLYTNAHATSPWTLPSHASMFTGLYPFEHGCHRYDHGGPIRDPDMPREEIHALNAALMEASSLDPSFLTLAEVMAGNGYRTGAVIANPSYLSEKYRLDQGFETYDIHEGGAREINELALQWLDGKQDKPFFLFLNYMDTHLPYACHAREGFPDVGTQKDANRVVTGLRKVTVNDDPQQIAARVRRMSWMYDVSLANLDEQLGALFDRLRELDLFDRSLIIVTSDHGEFLGEHELIEHGQDVYEPVLGIPLIVKAPGQTAGETDGDVISLTHVPGLVLGAAHLPDLPEGIDKLSSHWPRRDAIAENRLFGKNPPTDIRFRTTKCVRRVIYFEDYKYIESSDGRHELYDLARDPGELDNLIDREGEAKAALAELLARHTSAGGPVAAPAFPELTPEELETMKQLGY
jgi:arylsulfatase A-like enzyme